MQRSGQSAATMFAVRAPQSHPATMAFCIRSASINAMTEAGTPSTVFEGLHGAALSLLLQL